MPEEFIYGETAANQIISTFIDMFRNDPDANFDNEAFETRKKLITGNRSKVGGTADTMLENQGAIRFSRQEFIRFIQLVRCTIHKSGPQAGRPDYKEIARILNKEFEGVRPVREGKNLSDLIRTYRVNYKNKPLQYPNIDDPETSIEIIVNSYHPVES